MLTQNLPGGGDIYPDTGGFFWNWSRSTAGRRVHEVMEMAQISGLQATSKGLLHGFGVIAVESRIPLNLIREWMGHSTLEITAAYTAVHNCSDREVAARMWDLPAGDSGIEIDF